MYSKKELSNGLRLILVPQPQSLAATILVLVQAGSEYETRTTNGISHFLEHLVFKGTTKRPTRGMIAAELDALGASYNAFTGQEYTGYWAKSEKHKLSHILDIVSDLYLNPLFDQEEIEKERGVIIEEINMHEDTPMRKVHSVVMKALYGDQPAGWEVSGSKEIIRRLARPDIVRYRDSRYVAGTTVVVVAGAFAPRDVQAAITKAFGVLPPRRVARKTRTAESQNRPRALGHYKESDQSHMVLGVRAFDVFDRRRYALEVLTDILGGGMSARLWRRVREELGAAYYVRAGADLSLDHGHMAISAGVDTARVEIVLRAILEELRRAASENVSREELRKAKDHMIGSLILGLETSDELAGYYGGQEILTGTIDTPDELIAHIEKVTPEEVRRVARALFRDRNLNLALVGPHKTTARFEKALRIPS